MIRSESWHHCHLTCVWSASLFSFSFHSWSGGPSTSGCRGRYPMRGTSLEPTPGSSTPDVLILRGSMMVPLAHTKKTDVSRRGTSSNRESFALVDHLFSSFTFPFAKRQLQIWIQVPPSPRLLSLTGIYFRLQIEISFRKRRRMEERSSPSKPSAIVTNSNNQNL